MDMSTIWKGISVGASVGTAAFLLVNSSGKRRSGLKRHAGKMLRAAGDVLDDITSAVK
ncbi:MAG: hypothetical protein IKI21_12475 [Oscillospiraceae bacterium]|nr:hypothetical protein [Oscillospiraceae bacterium]